MQLQEAHRHRQLNWQESQVAADKALALLLPDKRTKIDGNFNCLHVSGHRV